MSQMKNVKRSKGKSGAASPEVGAPTRHYSKGAGQRNLKPVGAGVEKGRK